MINKDIVSKINDFRNEVLCRHEANQEKATKIWSILGPLLTNEEKAEIYDDWIHYIGGGCCTTISQFGTTLKNISTKYSNTDK